MFTQKVMDHLVENIDWSKEEILAHTIVKHGDDSEYYAIDLPTWWIYYYPEHDEYMLVDWLGFKGFGKTLPEARKDLDRGLEVRKALCA
jgi:hypothetical protein